MAESLASVVVHSCFGFPWPEVGTAEKVIPVFEMLAAEEAEQTILARFLPSAQLS